jgi:hypothetical protein
MISITTRCAAIAGIFALAGCVAPPGKGVLRADSAFPKSVLLTMAPSAVPQTPTQTHFQRTTERALIQMGYSIGPKGDYVVETAISERPLNVEFKTDGGLNSTVAKLPIIAICPQRVQRLTIAIIDARSGRPLYQGEAETTQCAGNIADKADGLARAALANLQTLSR